MILFHFILLLTDIWNTYDDNDVICHYYLCCRRHVVGQRAVSDISVICGCWNYLYSLLRLLTAVRGMPILHHIPSIICPATWRRVLDDHRQRT